MYGANFDPLLLIGLVYAVTLSIVSAYLWTSGRFSARMRYLLLIITIILGFATFSPMIPHQFQSLIERLADGQHIGTILFSGIIGLGILTLLAALFGRQFCGYLCPIGAVQEAAYTIPTKKILVQQKGILSVIRALFLVAIIGGPFLFGIALLDYFGFPDFFKLTFSTGTLVFIVILLIAIPIYRPFCRIICPMGAILQIGTLPAIYRIRRTDACIECGRCERACPTNEAKAGDNKGECYLCRRCIEVCPKDGALVYGRKRV
ncbi:4Fe-4S binding protein [Methanocalculus taiwanensis]|uniref:4Fe-4S binding protein n=1 Tax=Methanocalculus taiwanensis TaxID=106207 RepID=A0ABD4TLH0_9EURY|nr:4Fe-4S binding protein [Methanocalculus taiwanensis]MCQ1539049.1 4Fe-4S binding protein [Methanocalculus taiwanensis]